MPNILRRLKINEVSSVDRGAGEGVNIALLKRDDDGEPVDNADKKSSLTTRVSEFFSNLFRAEPQASAAEQFDGALAGLAESVKSIVTDDGEADRDDMLAKSFAQFHEYVSPLLGDRVLQQPTDKQGDLPMSAILKALGLKEDASEEDALKAIAEMAKARRKNGNGKNGDKEEEEEEEEEEKEEKALKALPEKLRKQLEEGAEAKRRVEKLEHEAALVAFTKQAVDAGMPPAEGVTLQKAYAGDKEAIDKIVTLCKTGFASAREAGAFKEFGASGAGGAATAFEQVTALAQKYLKDHPGEKLTPEQAFAKVYQDPANKSLRIQDARETGRV